MKPNFNRRDFSPLPQRLRPDWALASARPSEKSQAAEPVLKTKLHKALIMNRPTEEGLKKLKEAGFDGVEAGILSPDEAEKCRALADKLGLRIHAWCSGLGRIQQRGPEKVEETFATLRGGFCGRPTFGADAVLLVPCRIGGMKMPRPWEFLLEFDEKTGHLTKVAYGDNAPYAEYIKAHNHATDTSGNGSNV